MKILLTKDVKGLGRTGDVKDVSDGHARNFLIPRHLALPATTEVLTKVQKEEKEKQAKVTRIQEFQQQLKNKLSHQEFEIKARASSNSLFAAVHEDEIASAINQKFPDSLDANKIVIEKPIKHLGLHEVLIKLNETINFKIRLKITAL
ncbi:MAG: 50S ribosomal protein L9 [Candidatus Doudnabacteria bacterium RIFCSPLOWO2_02_FULL_49_13]|uniref:Large ribosomal subunit protein bL9 n=1 Tax=Candidatus Doudnabacteria bacterium RIFCSPHIGHO2_12_FULL_48_16 TaxID=1817838 RepID=A0A1F5PL44_9BACT|nr:MAG: 50S ribosomal protein L9 [Candidatus Doudnabacteria bacterium RIFCSPHIGHO2_02_FULL_49_24]OGE89289.1 MAG: 50S ribosomal protein L9 [Candidatus Doudnabacteria bacterium RIFCSPHIGHO2_01_FULL_50_67]OGE90589.1 MAG: 50S ribosomal protein L9 [Candidatus Doudnabacteria bacterium RIFCSPHIGHO2_12_FULL_48_16]OGE97626.1 MAG: 50S ribosomal protein L9 [Candidatus Doudnabacteria bacterium RIFCSPLOWO2_01_FULL_49_40]OGF02981.1 MAG: 50S ribosomal protein L9 [Candidatus Doudnabacteria bacterium RIFCSPLOWO